MTFEQERLAATGIEGVENSGNRLERRIALQEARASAQGPAASVGRLPHRHIEQCTPSGFASNPGVSAWGEDRTARSTYRPVERATAHLELAIDLDSDPITGSVGNGPQSAKPFSGWIELVAAIEAARSSAGHPGDLEEPESQTLGLFPGAKVSEL